MATPRFKIYSWNDIPDFRRYRTLPELLRKYGMKMYKTVSPDIFYLENGDKSAIVTKGCMMIGCRVIHDRRDHFWIFPPFASDEVKDLPSNLLTIPELRLAFRREISLDATFVKCPGYRYLNGKVEKLFGSIGLPIALIVADEINVHIFFGTTHIIRDHNYMTGHPLVFGDLPENYRFFSSKVKLIQSAKSFNNLLELTSGIIEDATHPQYCVESRYGNFDFFAVYPAVIEFKDPDYSIVMPTTFDITIDNVQDYVSLLPQKKMLKKMLASDIAGSMAGAYFSS